MLIHLKIDLVWYPTNSGEGLVNWYFTVWKTICSDSINHFLIKSHPKKCDKSSKSLSCLPREIFTDPSASAGSDTWSVFKRSLKSLNSECFQDWLPYHYWWAQFILLVTRSRRENGLTHTFPKGIRAMWNARISSRIWSCSAVSIFYGNYNTTNAMVSGKLVLSLTSTGCWCLKWTLLFSFFSRFPFLPRQLGL